MIGLVFRLMTLCALAFGLAASAHAQLQSGRPNNIAVSLVAESPQVAPGGAVSLAFVMRPKPTWHGYWKNPGDAGTEAQVEWTLPEGLEAGELAYPVPDRLLISGLMNYVYEHDYAVLTELKVPQGIAPGTRLPIRAKLDYLACTDKICVPESATVSTMVEVGAAAQSSAAFDAYRQALPRPIDRQGRFEVEGERLRIAIPLAEGVAMDDPYVFPVTRDALLYSAEQQVSRVGGEIIVETAADPDAAALRSFDGVLEIVDGQALSFTAVPGEVAAAGPSLGGGAGLAAVLIALLGAVAGGVLLNIMPCVFPILSLKALHLASAGGDERHARREAMAYAAGVILTCLALGGAVLALRAGGAAAGWAFQLQDPRVILLLLLLVIGIAFNLAGLFELPSFGGGERLARSGGTMGAFWTGVLAAFVATPCTGPFMGAALGAALVLPTAAALAVFAGLGFGLALPFLLLGFVPALRRRLPKPGMWMVRLRHILSVPMFLTALGLAWVLGRQAGVDGMSLGLAAALVLGLALWWVGRGRSWLGLVPALAVAVAAALLLPTTAPAEARAASGLGAEPFSEARLAELRGEERPVFVYFTADWCVTCKVNEKTVLDRDEVAQAFEEKNVAVLVGDWTRGDPAIGRFLAQHGRSGVPLYLYYAPGGDAEVLPQVLTVGRVTEL